MPKNLFSLLRISSLAIAAILISYTLTSYDTGKDTHNFFIGSKNNPPARVESQSKTYQITNPEITGLAGRWGVAVKDLKTDETYLLAADEKFPAASIYKLATLYKAYDAISAGELKKDDVVSGSISSLQETLSPADASPIREPRDEPEYTSMSVENALNLMITISDNSAAILLSERLGWGNIDAFMEAQNLAGIDLVEKDSPTVTAASILALLERIYRHAAVDWQSSEEMQQLLFAQKVNDRIPKYLPEATRIGHKTGELEDVRHDAGIVLGQQSHYIFVFLTQSANPTEAAENIAKLSKGIYDAMEARWSLKTNSLLAYTSV